MKNPMFYDDEIRIEVDYVGWEDFQPGDKVTWSNGIGNTFPVKKEQPIGIFLTYLPPGESAKQILPKGISGNQLKGQDVAQKTNRAIVAVPRGGKSQLVDYYMPNVKWLRHINDSE
ncbi:hypothetical protein DFP93_101199 [Aneurinibacillus soli]|uniref:Uncharacterized protein n=1 Tax=Aneurinibacillus soli TaxID=1500254 RepID=A0A0U4WHI8_9BACL|nr:hypothetical protein [Aneurinibacillus soli]PYE64174.1 hypothetical protein DFP93_101199 [Aneurinibacillus soli]BAU28123.1 hypothetical protein CB4_02297 [Aneurinibacillus soli]